MESNSQQIGPNIENFCNLLNLHPKHRRDSDNNKRIFATTTDEINVDTTCKQANTSDKKVTAAAESAATAAAAELSPTEQNTPETTAHQQISLNQSVDYVCGETRREKRRQKLHK